MRKRKVPLPIREPKYTRIWYMAEDHVHFMFHRDIPYRFPLPCSALFHVPYIFLERNIPITCVTVSMTVVRNRIRSLLTPSIDSLLSFSFCRDGRLGLGGVRRWRAGGPSPKAVWWLANCVLPNKSPDQACEKADDSSRGWAAVGRFPFQASHFHVNAGVVPGNFFF